MLIKRAKENPILKPTIIHAWEGQATFHGCPAQRKDKIYLLYRALSIPYYHALARTNMTTSVIGITASKDGIHFKNRRRFIVPEYEWEKFGCEDPRVTKFNNKYYIFYTALSTYPFKAEGIKVGLAISEDLKIIKEKHLITPFNAKAMALFPEKIGGKIWAILTVHTDMPFTPAKICLASFDQEKEIWSEDYWKKWYQNFEKYSLPFQHGFNEQVEVGSPPLKTKEGWLLLHARIYDYQSHAQKFFGVEATLLNLKDPLKIIGKIEVPVLIPEEYYEKFGITPNSIFPSGAMIKDDWIYFYYSGADTTCCLAFIKLSTLLAQILEKDKEKGRLERAKENPIMTPIKENSWESEYILNPAAVYIQDRVHIIYRAVSKDKTSVFGYANSQNGVNIDYRSPQPIYVPRESFEKKFQPGVLSGCEDPRLTEIEDKIYMTYTAYNGISAQVALSWILTKDFLEKKWNWAKPVLISPPDAFNKNAFIFPEKVNGKYLIIHRIGNDIDYSFTPTLNFKGDAFLEEHRWIYVRKKWWDSKRIGAVAPPLKTKKGWIMFYHGVSEDNIYRVGAVLLDLKNPIKILSRTVNPIFEPELPYEKEGWVPNVVFPCGNVIIDKKIFVYYGGADKVVGVATIPTNQLLGVLKLSQCSQCFQCEKL